MRGVQKSERDCLLSDLVADSFVAVPFEAVEVRSVMVVGAWCRFAVGDVRSRIMCFLRGCFAAASRASRSTDGGVQYSQV
jgi:hypothetical protein